MMKVMRETVPKSEMSLDSPATDVYRSMLDSETAQIAARTGGVGLADQIIAYLQGQRYTATRGSTEPGTPAFKGGNAPGVTRAPETSTGGNDESRTHGK
jgi:Rod binding domain-containing protein